MHLEEHGPNQFSVHVADGQNGGIAVTVFGELDAATAPRLKQVLDRSIEGEGKGEVVIDLRACGFIDSAGIAVIATTALRLKEQRRTLVMRGVRDRIRRILDIAGLTSQDSIVLEPTT
jgi:anti-sigma B factor antagonist